MSLHMVDHVVKFMEAFGQHTDCLVESQVHLYEKLIHEEYEELQTALTPEEEFREALDLIWVLIGYARSSGMNNIRHMIDQLNSAPVKKSYEWADMYWSDITLDYNTLVNCQKVNEVFPSDVARVIRSICSFCRAMGHDVEGGFAELARANMSKLGDDGKPILREDGKVLKSPNFTPPNLYPFLG